MQQPESPNFIAVGVIYIPGGGIRRGITGSSSTHFPGGDGRVGRRCVIRAAGDSCRSRKRWTRKKVVENRDFISFQMAIFLNRYAPSTAIATEKPPMTAKLMTGLICETPVRP